MKLPTIAAAFTLFTLATMSVFAFVTYEVIIAREHRIDNDCSNLSYRYLPVDPRAAH